MQYLNGKSSMGWAYWAMNGNDRYALFNNNFNGIVNQSKLTLLQPLMFPLDQQPGNTPAISGVNPASGAVGSSVTVSRQQFRRLAGHEHAALRQHQCQRELVERRRRLPPRFPTWARARNR